MLNNSRRNETIKESIKDLFKRYMDFSGESSRKQFVSGILFSLIPVFFVCIYSVYDVVNSSNSYEKTDLDLKILIYGVGGIFCAIWYLVTIIPMLALITRRIRSIGWSQWSWLLMIVPFICYLFILMLCIMPHKENVVMSKDNNSLEKVDVKKRTKRSKKNKKCNKGINKRFVFVLGFGLIVCFFIILLKFIENWQAKSICAKIASEFNNTRTMYYLDAKKGMVYGDNFLDYNQVNAFDWDYYHISDNTNNERSYDKDVCKIWVKENGYWNRPYVVIEGDFYLVDKHNAKIQYTNKLIKKEINHNEVISMTFEYYSEDFKSAKSVVFSHNNCYLPMRDFEYCIEQDRLYKEAKEVYNYEYNDLLSCSCNSMGSNFYWDKKDNSKCKIFEDIKVQQNCLLLRNIIPSCNEYLKNKK